MGTRGATGGRRPTGAGGILLLTGRPGVGKTTVVRRVAATLPRDRLAGFYTEEVRHRGRRRGFRAVTFNGWTTGQTLTREEPPEVVAGPGDGWEAYDWLETSGRVAVHAWPNLLGEAVQELAAGTPVQVKGLSWDETIEGWWYLIEGATIEGWVQSAGLK